MHPALDAERPDIARALERLLAGLAGESARAGRAGAAAARRLAAFAARGKMVRGGLVVLGWRMFGGEGGPVPRREVLRAAAALELLHSALLVHDDIMDGDRLRRGEPTVHARYEAEARKARAADPARVGMALGVAAGDLAIFAALAEIASLEVGPVLRAGLSQRVGPGAGPRGRGPARGRRPRRRPALAVARRGARGLHLQDRPLHLLAPPRLRGAARGRLAGDRRPSRALRRAARHGVPGPRRRPGHVRHRGGDRQAGRRRHPGGQEDAARAGDPAPRGTGRSAAACAALREGGPVTARRAGGARGRGTARRPAGRAGRGGAHGEAGGALGRGAARRRRSTDRCCGRSARPASGAGPEARAPGARSTRPGGAATAARAPLPPRRSGSRGSRRPR